GRVEPAPRTPAERAGRRRPGAAVLHAGDGERGGALGAAQPAAGEAGRRAVEANARTGGEGGGGGGEAPSKRRRGGFATPTRPRLEEQCIMADPAAGGTPTLAAARAYREAGLSVVPVKRDGSKAPAVKSWQRYQAALPPADDIDRWFD